MLLIKEKQTGSQAKFGSSPGFVKKKCIRRQPYSFMYLSMAELSTYDL